MRYAKLEYARSLTDMAVPPLLRYLPGPLLRFYIEKANPVVCLPDTILDAEGYRLILPMTEAEAKQNPARRDTVFFRTIAACREERELGIVILPRGSTAANLEFPIADGRAAFAMTAFWAAKKLLKRQKKNLAEAEFLLIDGGNFVSGMLLDLLYPNVNYLSVLTDRVGYMEERAAEIFCECGLNMQVFSNPRHPMIREADIIFNGAMELSNYDYLFQRGSIYLDVNKNTEKLKRIMGKRSDMFFYDNLEFKLSGAYLTTETLEAYCYLKLPEAERFFNRQYERALLERAMEKFENMGLSIAGFRCLGKPAG